jgi:Ca2+/Na+ antiporter
VNFFDADLRRNYFSTLSIVSLILSFVLIAVEVPKNYKTEVGFVLLLLLSFYYLYLWLRANLLTKMEIDIDNSIIEIKIGDIFKENGLKVIAFNEYFDTLVNNRIISDTTLNGMYIKRKINDITELDRLIEEDVYIKENFISTNEERIQGKKKKYKLGSIYEHDDYLLTAFSRFDNSNKAFLNMNDFINFLLHFWNEIDRIYNGRSVSIPLLGSGITRLKEYNSITDQELLELLIWSFKISRIKFTYPSRVTIVIHNSRKDKINFYKLMR